MEDHRTVTTDRSVNPWAATSLKVKTLSTILVRSDSEYCCGSGSGGEPCKNRERQIAQNAKHQPGQEVEPQPFRIERNRLAFQGPRHPTRTQPSQECAGYHEH